MLSEQDFDFNGDVFGPDVSFIGIDKLHLCKGNLRVLPDENRQFRSDLIPGFSIRIGDLLDRL